jgi:hypothetical protein
VDVPAIVMIASNNVPVTNNLGGEEVRLIEVSKRYCANV